ncbi:LysM peptidoglycan-binding domain-containing protein [Salinivibrio sp. IB872]|uniref:LysM peptidoglycan-binding domain-containing protein n=1 Tax=Salinivibrio sp. IB872 TaxID=1766123 RepID=UPI0009C60593|nr:LysM domain-containing protein [Salinivibrio sp. IB872]OOF25988.1 hypothetical protein BZJ18_10450 [Salinivibrio sp. IB872]
MKEYKITKGDCLSLIAEKFDVSTEDLLKLNSTQIKDPDFIYAGDTLKIELPEPANTDTSRTPLTPPPTQPATEEECQIADFVDVLYVPAHPETGERCWYAITQEAKDLIEEESGLMRDAVVEGDNEATLANINKLGILSKFATRPHEAFMAEDEREDYKRLLYLRLVVERDVYKRTDDPKMFLVDAAKDLGLNPDILTMRADRHSHSYYGSEYHAAASMASNHHTTLSNAIMARLKAAVLNAIDERTKELEGAAEKRAGNVNTDDGTRFVYRHDLKYFTSRREETIERYINDYQYSLTRQDLYQSPPSRASYVLQSVSEDPSKDNRINAGLSWTIKQLNNHGFACKEQCLTQQQLVGEDGDISAGPQVLCRLGESWRTSPEPISIDQIDTINKLYEEITGSAVLNNSLDEESLANDITKAAWAYYPAKAVIHLMDITLESHKNALNQILGQSAGTPLDELFNKLLTIKSVAKARIALLRKLALANVNQGPNALPFVFADEKSEALPPTLTMVWDDDKYRPKNKSTSAFANDAGYNDIQPVECSLLSTGKVFYLRGPEWYMPKDEQDDFYAKACRHVEPITRRITFISQQTESSNIIEANSLDDVLDGIKNKKFTINLLPLKAESKFDTVFWQDSYHIQGGQVEGINEPAYSADAGAQFLRFTSAAQGDVALNQPLASYKGQLENPQKMGASGNISASLGVLQGQVSVCLWLPQNDNNKALDEKSTASEVTGHPVMLDYVDESGRTFHYDAGKLMARISGALYGLVGVTCQLGTSITVGPADYGKGFGIRGSVIKHDDPNIYRNATENLTEKTEKKLQSSLVATQAEATVDAFMGVEVGGSLGSDIYWIPPKQKKAKPLGKINGQLSAAYGLGAHRDFSIVFQGGVLILKASGGVVMGPGCRGTFAIEVHSANADDFIDCLLGVLKRSNFRRLSVFGEVDENGVNDTFNILNDLATLAVGLGLSFSKVLLLPPNLIEAYKKDVTSKEYAPFLAKQLTDDRSVQSSKKWILNIPTSSLSNLLNALLKQQTTATSEGSAKSTNQRQAQAILNIMSWLSNDQTNQNEHGPFASQRQWKEALIEMADLHAGADKPQQWEAFRKSWYKIAIFVVRATAGGRSVSMMRNSFDESSKALCNTMVLTNYTKTDNTRRLGPVANIEYRAYARSVVANASIRRAEEIKIKNDEGNNYIKLVPEENEKIIDWSLKDVGL